MADVQLSTLGSVVKTAYEGNANTNAFTDAEQTKLTGIETAADVTDTTNVTAAGALMDSEVTNLAQVKAFSSADYATAAQGATADTALQNVVEDTTPQLGGNLDVQARTITTSTVNGGITLTPNGTGDVTLGTLVLDADQVVGAGTDNYVLTYDNAGGKIALEAAAGGGDVATDTIFDAAGDIVQGTGANTAARLAIGTASQQLRVNAGATALEYFTPSAGAGDFKADGTVDMTGEFRTDVGTFDSDVADGASAVAFKYDTAVSYANALALLARWDNNGVAKAAISKDGQFYSYGHGTESAPAYSFDIGGNRAYGMYYASGELRFSHNGVQQLAIASKTIKLAAGTLSNLANAAILGGYRRAILNRTSSVQENADSQACVVTNAGAGAGTTSTLPSATAGGHQYFADNNTGGNRMTVVPATGDEILWTDGTVVSAATGSLVSTARGDSFYCIALDATRWQVFHHTGTWTVTA